MDPPERPWKRPRHWLPRPLGSARAPDKGKPKDSDSIGEGPDKDKPKDRGCIKEGPETGKPKDLDFSQASLQKINARLLKLNADFKKLIARFKKINARLEKINAEYKPKDPDRRNLCPWYDRW